MSGMIPRRTLTVIAAALLSACSLPDKLHLPGKSRPANPLLGTWKFDAAATAKRTAAYNARHPGASATDEDTSRLIRSFQGSSLMFTDKTIIVSLTTGDTLTTRYAIRSVTRGGEVTVVNQEGQESFYTVSGNKLINTAPDLNFVGVFTRK